MPAIPLFCFSEYRLLDSRVAGVRFGLMTWADLWKAWVR
jgi:hypothetical protein